MKKYFERMGEFAVQPVVAIRSCSMFLLQSIVAISLKPRVMFRIMPSH
jgi:hypothetical protein